VWARLQTLDLADNNLGPAGAKLIAAALKSLPRLKELHLSTNHVAAAGANDLALALRALPEVIDVSPLKPSLEARKAP
jgi:Ran GTPase-activating protein (RanGAP) involved in mRNA processing and transport